MGSGAGGCNLQCQWIIACGCGAAAYYEAVGLMMYRMERDGKYLSDKLKKEFDETLEDAREYVRKQALIIQKLTKRFVPLNIDSVFDIAFTIRTFSLMEGFTSSEAEQMVKLAQALAKAGMRLATILLISQGLPENVDPYQIQTT